MSTKLTAVLQQILQNTTNLGVLRQLMTPDVTYVSLNFDDLNSRKLSHGPALTRGLSRSPRCLRASRVSGRHSILRSPTRLSRATAWPSSAPLPTNPTQPEKKSHLLLACWRVSKGTRLLTSSFKRTATAPQGHSKQGAPRASTAILREKRSRSDADQVVTANSPVVKDEIPERVGGSRQWLVPRCRYWRTQITQSSITNKEPYHEQ